MSENKFSLYMKISVVYLTKKETSVTIFLSCVISVRIRGLCLCHSVTSFFLLLPGNSTLTLFAPERPADYIDSYQYGDESGCEHPPVEQRRKRRIQREQNNRASADSSIWFIGKNILCFIFPYCVLFKSLRFMLYICICNELTKRWYIGFCNRKRKYFWSVFCNN